MKDDKDKEEHASQLSYEKSGRHCNATVSAQTAPGILWCSVQFRRF